MPLPASLADMLELPVVGSPLFIVSGPNWSLRNARPASLDRFRR